MIPKKADAISALVSGPITATTDGSHVVYHDGQTPPTEEEIETKFKQLQDEYNAQEYARTRKPLYPDIGDQLDDLYKKGAFSDEMTAKIKKVKEDNPKPS